MDLTKRTLDRCKEQGLELRAENERLRTALMHLYWWSADMPIKHPQQAEWQQQAKELLGIK